MFSEVCRLRCSDQAFQDCCKWKLLSLSFVSHLPPVELDNAMTLGRLLIKKCTWSPRLLSQVTLNQISDTQAPTAF